MREFRFRPRLRALPVVACALGIAILLLVPLGPFSIACGVLGPLLGALALFAPAWRYRVLVDQDGLSALRKDVVRFRLPWAEVRGVVVEPEGGAVFVDGGEPGRSLLVPGPRTRAPYRIERSEELVNLILTHVPKDKLR